MPPTTRAFRLAIGGVNACERVAMPTMAAFQRQLQIAVYDYVLYGALWRSDGPELRAARPAVRLEELSCEKQRTESVLMFHPDTLHSLACVPLLLAMPCLAAAGVPAGGSCAADCAQTLAARRPPWKRMMRVRATGGASWC